MGVLPPAVHGILRCVLQTVIPCHPFVSPFCQGTANHPSQRNLGGINQRLHGRSSNGEPITMLNNTINWQICIHSTMTRTRLTHLSMILSNPMNIMIYHIYIYISWKTPFPELGSEPLYTLVADSTGCSQAPL